MLFYVKGSEADTRRRQQQTLARLAAEKRKIREAESKKIKAERAANAAKQHKVRQQKAAFQTREVLGQTLDGLPARAKALVLDICQARRVRAYDVLSTCRKNSVVCTRHEIMHRMHEDFEWGYCEIGRRLNRDHSSVLHGIRRHLQRMQEGA